MKTFVAPATIDWPQPAKSPTRAAGLPPICTVVDPGGTIGVVPCGPAGGGMVQTVGFPTTAAGWPFVRTETFSCCCMGFACQGHLCPVDSEGLESAQLVGDPARARARAGSVGFYGQAGPLPRNAATMAATPKTQTRRIPANMNPPSTPSMTVSDASVKQEFTT